MLPPGDFRITQFQKACVDFGEKTFSVGVIHPLAAGEVGFVTSLSFELLCDACEALPEMSMTVFFTKMAWSMDELQFVGVPHMVDNFA